MSVRGAKTIAEYAIRTYLEQEGFAMDYFLFKMTGPQEGELKDRNGDVMKFVYNPATRTVIPVSMAGEEI